MADRKSTAVMFIWAPGDRESNIFFSQAMMTEAEADYIRLWLEKAADSGAIGDPYVGTISSRPTTLDRIVNALQAHLEDYRPKKRWMRP